MNSIKKVVLIDDDKIFNLIHELKLKDTGLVDIVESFSDPEVAVEYLRTTSEFSPDSFPEIILLDLNMPTMDGWQCLDRFSTFTGVFRRSRIMILSSSVAVSDRVRSRDYAMVSGFMSKPLDKEKIGSYFNEYLEQE